jgi:hypothetical protein
VDNRSGCGAIFLEEGGVGFACRGYILCFEMASCVSIWLECAEFKEEMRCSEEPRAIHTHSAHQ